MYNKYVPYIEKYLLDSSKFNVENIIEILRGTGWEIVHFDPQIFYKKTKKEILKYLSFPQIIEIACYFATNIKSKSGLNSTERTELLDKTKYIINTSRFYYQDERIYHEYELKQRDLVGVQNWLENYKNRLNKFEDELENIKVLHDDDLINLQNEILEVVKPIKQIFLDSVSNLNYCYDVMVGGNIDNVHDIYQDINEKIDTALSFMDTPVINEEIKLLEGEKKEIQEKELTKESIWKSLLAEFGRILSHMAIVNQISKETQNERIRRVKYFLDILSSITDNLIAQFDGIDRSEFLLKESQYISIPNTFSDDREKYNFESEDFQKIWLEYRGNFVNEYFISCALTLRSLTLLCVRYYLHIFHNISLRDTSEWNSRKLEGQLRKIHIEERAVSAFKFILEIGGIAAHETKPNKIINEDLIKISEIGFFKILNQFDLIESIEKDFIIKFERNKQ